MERLQKKKLYYNLVLAMSINSGIGKGGKLPWNLPTDMKFFKTVTSKVFDENESLTKIIADHFIKSSKNTIFDLLKSNQEDYKQNICKKNIVVMGRQTWDSIPLKFKPLSNRINVVLSRNMEFIEKHPSQENLFYAVSSLEEFYSLAERLDNEDLIDNIYVIGGSQIYKEFLQKSLENLKLIFQTYIQKEYECDVFFEMPEEMIPLFVSKTMVDEKESDTCFDFRILVNKNILREMHIQNESVNSQVLDGKISDSKKKITFQNIIDPYFFSIHPAHEEFQYLNAIRDIIGTGIHKSDRTGVGTISKFGYTMRFDCSKSFPLLTTKDTFWRGILEELLWFINGDTNAKHLQEKKVHIWDGNASREFLDNLGFQDREEGDLGPVYGFQWRHSGADYKTMHDNYDGQGIDQLMNVINDIKNNPDSRRIIMCMALPPCHVLCQFYVENNDQLSLQMYQRSADMGLGVPFNIASYALLLYMVATVTNKKIGNFIHTIGDAHVYKSHVSALEKQLLRIPRAFPILQINKEVREIDQFKFTDFKLVGYKPYPKIKMDMAI